MSFRDDAKLDTSQVSDRRGMGGMRGVAAGGGGLGLLLMIAAAIFGVNPFEQGGSSTGTSSRPAGGLQGQTAGGQSADAALAQRCRTGADANTLEDCRIVGYVNSIQKFWSDEFVRSGSQYRLTKTTFFTGSTQTGCGNATSQVGPFYCPSDETIYIDLDFFNELTTKFGANGGPFAKAYVIAHEYGHHVQDLTGVLDQRNGDRSGPQSQAVRTELQADCYAGVWANNAVETGYLKPLTEAEIASALSAASAVGDDRIQKQVQGRVNPESWTHGSSEQRQRWFMQGYQNGRVQSCDTFRGGV